MNKIIFALGDGIKATSNWNGFSYVCKPAKLFGVERIELDTKKTLHIGDYVRYKNYITKVIERHYYPEENYFRFLCEDIYTGRKE